MLLTCGYCGALCWMAKAAAGVSRSSHCAAPAGRTEVARRYGRTIAAMTAVTAVALRRSRAPVARAHKHSRKRCSRLYQRSGSSAIRPWPDESISMWARAGAARAQPIGNSPRSTPQRRIVDDFADARPRPHRHVREDVLPVLTGWAASEPGLALLDAPSGSFGWTTSRRSPARSPSRKTSLRSGASAWPPARRGTRVAATRPFQVDSHTGPRPGKTGEPLTGDRLDGSPALLHPGKDGGGSLLSPSTPHPDLGLWPAIRRYRIADQRAVAFLTDPKFSAVDGLLG